MNKFVDVIIIRHAQSTANEYMEKNGISPTDPKYINAGLSNLGKYQVEMVQSEMLKYIQNPDIILTSPLKRAIQTCLLAYKDQKIDKIKIAAIVSELIKLTENTLVSRNINKNDPEIKSLPNYASIDWNDDKMYDSTWKQYYNNNPK